MRLWYWNSWSTQEQTQACIGEVSTRFRIVLFVGLLICMALLVMVLRFYKSRQDNKTRKCELAERVQLHGGNASLLEKYCEENRHLSACRRFCRHCVTYISLRSTSESAHYRDHQPHPQVDGCESESPPRDVLTDHVRCAEWYRQREHRWAESQALRVDIFLSRLTLCICNVDLLGGVTFIKLSFKLQNNTDHIGPAIILKSLQTSSVISVAVILQLPVL